MPWGELCNMGKLTRCHVHALVSLMFKAIHIAYGLHVSLPLALQGWGRCSLCDHIFVLTDLLLHPLS